MALRVKTLSEVEAETEEKIGEVKLLDPDHGYYDADFRRTLRKFEHKNQKITKILSFEGKKTDNSFGLFKSRTGYDSRLKNKKNHANDYGEYIAYIILKQLGQKVCKVDLGEVTIVNPYSHIPFQCRGILSHYQLRSKAENFLPILDVIDRYKSSLKDTDNSDENRQIFRRLIPKGRTYSPLNNTNIEVILKVLEMMCIDNGEPEKISQMRKDFFDMCIFDIKFANRDRHDENFGVKVNHQSKEISFYPLFDNEQILGFQTEQKEARELLDNPEKYKRFLKSELTSCIGIPEATQKIRPSILLTYLLEHYYDETMTSINNFNRYRLENLEEIMNRCHGLSDEHKELAKKIFLDREKEMNQIVSEYRRRKANDEQVL